MMHLIFVYGTLKSGQIRNNVLRDQRYIGIATTEPQYAMFQISGFPALVDSVKAVADGQPAPNRRVWGELYEVDEDCIAELDKIEGVSRNLFERREVKLDETWPSYLPTNGDVFANFFRKTAEAYIYKQSVAGAKECGSFWCHKF